MGTLMHFMICLAVPFYLHPSKSTYCEVTPESAKEYIIWSYLQPQVHTVAEYKVKYLHNSAMNH